MVRFWIIGIVVAVAFTLYSLVDAAMSDAARTRGVSKPVWILLIVLLPVIGGGLWFLVGKGKPLAQGPAGLAPDDDPRFTGTHPNQAEMDLRFLELQEQLRALDDETFPGESKAPQAGKADHPEPGNSSTLETGETPTGDDTPPAEDAPRDGGPTAR